MPTTEVILTEAIRGLGAEADIVRVKRGFARNFLLPTGRAYEVTPVTLKRITTLQAKRAEREAKERNEAEDAARKINKLKLTLTLETGSQGKAFGSITSRDVEEALKKELPALAIERHAIQLDRPIKEHGDHEIPVRLHPEVTATLKLHVKSNVETPAGVEKPAAVETANAAGDAKKSDKFSGSGKKKTSATPS
jgi:large subunit ribosomal protein L9